MLYLSARGPSSDLSSGGHFTSSAHPWECLLVTGIQRRIRAKSMFDKMLQVSGAVFSLLKVWFLPFEVHERLGVMAEESLHVYP